MSFEYKKDETLNDDATKIKYAFARQLSFRINLWDAFMGVRSLLNDIRMFLAEQNPSGMVKNPKIVILGDGIDHLNWLELGKKESRGIETSHISWTPNFGHLWQSGWISEKEIEKAKKGQSFKWLHSGISGHGHP